jgi:hypothetical protein
MMKRLNASCAAMSRGFEVANAIAMRCDDSHRIGFRVASEAHVSRVLKAYSMHDAVRMSDEW